jgi:hypothetical protein
MTDCLIWRNGPLLDMPRNISRPGVDGCRLINQLASFVVVVERLPHKVDVVG